MRVNGSLKVYPRLDQDFKKKSSLDFQKIWGNVYKLRPTGEIVQGYLWIAFMLIGFFMGALAFLLDILVEGLSHARVGLMQ